MIFGTPARAIDFASADHARRTHGSEPSAARTTVAGIGAGFSGTLLALHLLRQCPSGIRVHLIEKNRRVGRGLGHSTRKPNHLRHRPAALGSGVSDPPRGFLDL